MQLDLPGWWYQSPIVVAASVKDIIPTLAKLLPYDRYNGMLDTAKTEDLVYLETTCFYQIPVP